ncbi:ParB/RepB/Spo0J family partition protein [Giesbergeria anulus]|uniref:Chromosome partitioning protein, ParB family n=1 Tax=Giesbergeria anulus TaxID=180197 RepID=A0A1H9RID6_9BURK|nr:ParB N-terminal domain-containing protein [Giesbergeria anulus]SER71753.1 chromosome partitioning protein, ParB family [Giesbergeria anulus]
MSKPLPKLSGLIKSGAVVPATPMYGLPDIPGPVARDETTPLIETQDKVAPPETSNGGRKLTTVNVNLIDPNPLAPREVYTPEMIRDRAEDLRVQGQHDPIHVIPNPSAAGRFIICDGWTRVQACREHKVFDTLLAEIHTDLSMQESAWFGYEQNEGRSQHCDLDRAMFYEKLIAAGETAAEIARRAKLSKTMMSFYRAYGKLPEDVLEIIRLHPGKFGATEAYQLAKLYDKAGIRKTVSLANKYASEDQTQRWLTNQVQALLNPNAQKAKTAGKTIRYANGVYKQRGDSFELVITVSAEQREAFAQGLEELLEIAAIAPATAEDADEKHVEL